MAETYIQHAAEDNNYAGGNLCMNSEELECVYEDMRMMLEHRDSRI